MRPTACGAPAGAVTARDGSQSESLAGRLLRCVPARGAARTRTQAHDTATGTGRHRDAPKAEAYTRMQCMHAHSYTRRPSPHRAHPQGHGRRHGAAAGGLRNTPPAGLAQRIHGLLQRHGRGLLRPGPSPSVPQSPHSRSLHPLSPKTNFRCVLVWLSTFLPTPLHPSYHMAFPRVPPSPH